MMSADKKHKIEDEYHIFNEEWTVQYYSTKVGNKVQHKKTPPNQSCKLWRKFHQ